MQKQVLNPTSNRWVNVEGQIGRGLLDKYGDSVELRIRKSHKKNQIGGDRSSDLSNLMKEVSFYPCSANYLANNIDPKCPINPILLSLVQNSDKPIADWFTDSHVKGISTLVDIFKKACPDPIVCDHLLMNILMTLHLQDESNPALYVSHGADHSLRVMNIMIDMFNNSEILQKSMATNFPKLDKNGHKLILALVGVLHDIGYIDLISCNPKYTKFYLDSCSLDNNIGLNEKYKFLHAPGGASIIDTILTDQLNQMFGDKIVKSIIRSIKYHNYDVPNCSADPPPKSCVYNVNPKSHSLFMDPNTGEVKREYVEADVTTDPLLFSIRIADNADFSYDRLTKHQQQVDFISALRKLKEGDKNLTASEKATLIGPYDEHSYPHFYSNWIVKDVKLLIGDKQSELVVNLNGTTTPDGVVIPEDLRIIHNKPEAVYQIQRMAESSQSLTVNGNNFVDTVQVTLNNYPEPKQVTKKALASFMATED